MTDATGGREFAAADPATRAIHGADLKRDAIGGLGAFAQGLAAAAPSVALAIVPVSLFIMAGKGALWAVLIGLVLVALLATTISFQARRTVTSGSLGTYTGNGLGPGFAFLSGWSLLIGYIGFATTGVLGGVLYVNAVFDALGLGSDSQFFRLALVAGVAFVSLIIPYRGLALTAKYELIFEIIAIATILVVIIAAYITYGWQIDYEQFSLSHLNNSLTFYAAVVAVGSYAGFESVAALGAEVRNAHRNIARSLLVVVLILGGLYVLTTYPQILHFNEINTDAAILPALAAQTGVGWITIFLSVAVSLAYIVFVSALVTASSRGLFTLAREGALPKVLARVHPQFGTPHVGILLVGLITVVFSVIATLSSTGRLVFDIYIGYVATYGFLISYLLVAIATPIWLYRIKAGTIWHYLVSLAATLGFGFVVFNNFFFVDEYPLNLLPWYYLLLLVPGALWYLWLRRTQPATAARIGSIQTLSPSEQERLTSLGLLKAADEAQSATS
ncbi:APC family permease [Pseudogemmobacter hezensis]|uniref:APC family permease n=1 Tax=Pseudogemmobacter hezensis TaxID=2737662 RepID=UPI001C12EC3B